MSHYFGIRGTCQVCGRRLGVFPSDAPGVWIVCYHRADGVPCPRRARPALDVS